MPWLLAPASEAPFSRIQKEGASKRGLPLKKKISFREVKRKDVTLMQPLKSIFHSARCAPLHDQPNTPAALTLSARIMPIRARRRIIATFRRARGAPLSTNLPQFGKLHSGPTRSESSANSPLVEEQMFGNLLTVAGLKRLGRLLAMSALAILVADSGNAADLKLRINPAPSAESERPGASRRQETVSPEARRQLFDEFLEWIRTHR
ncbi:hypothetical protein [Bradyrhizobium sp.]|uniref:hypothetical protein n=1 Tax=Bradyrhizobium sp. TaxID=376 RepID=UPI003C74EA26